MRNVYGSVASIGMDVHYKFSTVVMRSVEGKVVRRERLEHPDRGTLRAVLAGWPQEVPCVLEASFGWAWLTDVMKEVGLQPALANSYKVEQMRKARGLAKTNVKDAELLSLLPLEATDWWKVWLAPPEVRDRREWMRYRSSLVAIGTATKNRIHAVFHRHGIFHEFSDLFGGKGRRFLGELCREGQAGEVRLSGGSLAGLRGLVRLLDHVRGQLAEVARALRGELERSPLARRLDGVPGFGLILAHTLMAEMGMIERFRDHGGLARYSVLAPISHDTGEEDGSRAPQGRHLGHRGNQTLKWAFIEAAHGAVKSGGKWRAMFDKYTDGGQKNRNRGYIKVARELVKVVYVVWKKGVEYTDSPPARPGSSRREQMERFFGSTRSGTGQSSQPMAAVR